MTPITRVWCRLVTNSLAEFDGPVFSIKLPEEDTVDDLKEKIKERSTDLDPRLPSRTLDLWMLEGVEPGKEQLEHFRKLLAPADAIAQCKGGVVLAQLPAGRYKRGRDEGDPIEEPPMKQPTLDNQQYARKLGHNEGNPYYRGMFSLWSRLWKQPQVLKDATGSISEAVPDLAGSRKAKDKDEDEDEDIDGDRGEDEAIDDTVSQADFIRAGRLVGDSPEDRPVLSDFMIRDEYRELDEYLDKSIALKMKEGKNFRAILVGQPGIGKTTYLAHNLLRRLAAGKRTIYSKNPYQTFLFEEDGVSVLLHSMAILFFARLGTLLLYDLNEKQTAPDDDVTCSIVLATSPQVRRYKEWQKENSAPIWSMKPWPWCEIFHGRKLYENKTTEELRDMFIRHGGSARVLYTLTPQEAAQRVEDAIIQCNDIGHLFPFGGFVSESSATQSASHALIKTYPEKNPDGTVNRLALMGQVATEYIFRQLMEKNKVIKSQSAESMFWNLFVNPDSRLESGAIFEGIGHNYLRRLLAEPLEVRPLNSPPGRSACRLELAHVKKVKYFDTQKKFKLNSKRYYQPLSSSLTGINSFVFDRESQVVAFQFTTLKSHPISPQFLTTLWKPDSKEVWRLVFVVPREIEGKFTAQPWTPPFLQGKWNERVEQYVLGLDSKEIWNDMRRTDSLRS